MSSIRQTASLDRYLGQILDEKYRLERLLGQGGMGAVIWLHISARIVT
jgi:hypothetical protein